MLTYCALLLVLSSSLAAPTFDLPLLPGALPERRSSYLTPFKEISYAPRIINGHPAVLGQFPHQVALYLTVSTGTAFCGGSLISENWVLTAAHCAEGVQAIMVYLGVISLSDPNGRVLNSAANIVVHPQWSYATIQNDLALVHLSATVVLTNVIKPVALGSDMVDGGLPATIVGWGRISDSATGVSNTLNYASVTTVTNDECKVVFGNIIGAGIICVQGATIESVCNGDSGGALVLGSGENFVQIGIASFVSDEGCGKGYPSAFTRVSAYTNWIHTYTGV